MVFLGGVEVAQGLDLDLEGETVLLGFVGNDFVDNGTVGGVGVVDACAVACSLVLALLVEAGGVDGLEVHVEQESEGGDGGDVAEMDRFGEARLVGVDLLVGWVGGVAVGEAHLGEGDAMDEFEVFFGAPEAAGGEVEVAFVGLDGREECDDFLEPAGVDVVEGGEVTAVDVEDGHYPTLLDDGHYYLAAAFGAAGDVAGELFHVGNDEGAVLFPCRAADAAAEGDVHASHGALEGTEKELGAADAVEAGPPEVERVVNHCSGIRHRRHSIGLAFK